jgi:hypothetical protein
MRRLLATAFAVGLFLAGCVSAAPEATPIPTPPPEDRPASGIDDLVGAWQAGQRRLLFREDGTFWWINIWDAEENGVFELEGAKLSVENTGIFETGGASCDASEAAIYQVQVVGGTSLRFSLVEDNCAERIEFLTSGGDRVWDPAPAPGPIASADDLAGVWERQGGHYAQFNDDGTFTCAQSRLDVEEGTECKGQLSFEGAQLSVEVDQCADGSAGVYRAERLDNGFLRFEKVEEDTCAWRAEFLTGPGTFEIAFEPTR